MKILLVPTDFSPVSENALSYAIVMAKVLKAKITLLHAYHTFPVDPGLLIQRDKEDLELFEKAAKLKLKAICEEIEKTTSCKCDFINIAGLAKDVIVSQAKEKKPVLLIIGTENRIAIDQFVFGTITGKVIKETECTLFVIPENAKYHPPKKIVFAMDYHDSDLRNISFILKFARKFRSAVDIVHVVSADENVKFEEIFFNDFKKEVKNRRTKINFELIKGEKVITELEKYINEEAIDVLSIAKTGKDFFDRLFTGSVSQKVFYNIRIPLLIFKAEDNLGDVFE
jgi:nucleotide-binding universal stress UspA family protein